MHALPPPCRARPDQARRPLRVALSRLWAPFLGGAALVWFLVRVIPKPSRAAYPCQRAAAPLASGFILWLLSLSVTAAAWRQARLARLRLRPGLGALCAAAAAVAAGGVFWGAPALRARAQAVPRALATPSLPPNTPIGTARGAHPGRVVWVRDPAAAAWDGTTGRWWEAAHTDRAAVSNLLAQAVCWLAGERGDAQAWDVLFRDFNHRQGRGPVGYAAGEKVAVKLNLNCSSGYTWGNGQNNAPQLVHALLGQLVHRAGVPPAAITVGDPSRVLGDPIYTLCQPDFPAVRYMDRDGGNGRVAAQPDLDVAVFHGDPAVAYHGARHPATAFTEATYVINLGLLRGHNLAGATLCAKNHFGSTWVAADQGGWHKGWHPGGPADDPMGGMHGYVNAYAYGSGAPGWTFAARPMGSYNSLVDLMGHADLGGKTFLFVVDGLYAALHQGSDAPLRWQSAPFNNHWTASLFASQDGVAIESVGLDFLLAEPQYGDTVCGTVFNVLHEAALAHDPPSGTRYDPEGDGVPLPSLGVHERWNNAADKQYSRNLGSGAGIDLVTAEPPLRRPRVVDLSRLPPKITWETTIGGVYRVECSDDLSVPESWLTLDGADMITAVAPFMSCTVTMGAPRAYFRIVRTE